jgi:hypothetical protein
VALVRAQGLFFIKHLTISVESPFYLIRLMYNFAGGGFVECRGESWHAKASLAEFDNCSGWFQLVRMKPSVFAHTAWGLAALATFVIGYQLANSGHADTSAALARSVAAQHQAEQAVQESKKTQGKVDDEAVANAASKLALPPLTAQQIDQLAKDAFTDPNPLTRNLAFSKMLASMTPENVQALMASMKTNRADGQQWNLFLYAWGSMDPAGALAHAQTLEGGQKFGFMNQTLPGWASKDPAGAIAWLDTMKDGDEKNRFRGSLVGGLADHDIGLATTYVLERVKAGDKQAGEFLQTVTGEALRKNGPVAAAAWGATLPDGPLKGGALDQIAAVYTRQDPAAAAAWAAQYATADYGARIIEEVSDNWAARDPKAAIAWLNTLTEGAGRSEGTYTALREWTQRDALAASQYLAAMPASPIKDSAVSGFARSLAREDPESAVIWAKTITNEASRVNALTRAGQYWFRRDPAAAANWLQSSRLPPATQEAIRNPPNDRGGRG